MGDLHLIGHPLLASYKAFRSGHALNNKLIRKLLSQEGAYELVSFVDASTAPKGYAQLMTV
jgi:UDP-3-O-[3-hydroxymyristoyl] N-acetylglucosamine deacetylase